MRQEAARPAAQALDPETARLFESLRGKRRELASAARPGTRAALAQIPGMGQGRIERYGDIMLAVLRGDPPQTSPLKK